MHAIIKYFKGVTFLELELEMAGKNQQYLSNNLDLVPDTW